MEAAIDMDAEDVTILEDGTIEVITKPHECQQVRQGLISLGFEVGFGDLIQKPNVENIFQGEEAEKMRKLLDALESLDDVQEVYTNALISTEG